MLNGLRLWLGRQLPLVPPKSALGKVMNYAYSNGQN